MLDDPDRAWRISVLPLGIVLIVCGVAAWVGAFTLPLGFVPFIEEIEHRRIAVVALGLASAGLGLGVLRRSRTAWRALFAYLALGILWVTAGVIWDHHFHVFADIRWFLVCLNLVMGAAIIGGIYATTRAVFRRPGGSET